MSILSLLGLVPAETERGSPTLLRITAGLEGLDPDRARFVAAFAVVLSRVAGVDEDIQPAEVTLMTRLAADKCGLPADQAALAVEMACHQRRLFPGNEDFLVTRELSRTATYGEKLGLLESLFAVAAADRRVRSTEADEIARIASELRIEPRDLSRLRFAYRDLLSVRRSLEDSST